MKILYVTTISNTVNAFLIPHIKMLVDKGHQVDVAFNTVQEVNPELTELGCKIHNIEFQRSPLQKSNFTAYKRIKSLVLEEGYELVHTHTPIASFLTRLACRKISNLKMLYTAHGFHFYKGAPILNWLVYYPIEKWLSRYTDILITINKEDYNRAKHFFKAGKVEYIPGVGLDFNKFNNTIVNKIQKRNEIGIPVDAFVILSVGELNHNKNHETTIRALAKLKNPDIYYVICGKGPLENYLGELIMDLDLQNQVRLLGFRNDIAEICKVSDLFLFPSKREGLGLAALEAMSVGLPIITSNVHGIVDYSVDGVTGYTCNPTDVNGFATSINKLMNDKILREKISENNISLIKRFDLKNVINRMKQIYYS